MLSNLPAFIIAMSLLTITPGLDTLLVIRNTTRGGLRDGFVTSLGICLGFMFTLLGQPLVWQPLLAKRQRCLQD
ncbi:putative threonine efflux protein [Vibrio ishigakensis]|uniref:Putative threonine efflux protein n=1 Tax=Vibrio ishigakensis TaxID=1481914 RepID=A0A0B8QAD2_9VIBR|nr:putative threonine efflux protein [Vibrio ishigakensis]